MPQIINNWPYSDMHNLNLDWVMVELKKMDIKLEQMDLFFPHVSTWNNGEWDIDHYYQMNEIVTNGNDIYIAKKNVPPDENINNTNYWMLIGTVDDMSNKVDKAGDTMTGVLKFLNCCPTTQNTDININSAPGSLINHDVIATYDANNSEVSMMRVKQTTGGDVGVEFDARRQVGGSTIFNGITFAIQPDGTRYIGVSDQGIWVNGLVLNWQTSANWAAAVSNAKMDIIISSSFSIGTSKLVLNVCVPVAELDSTPRFHFSTTGYASGDNYHAQARVATTGLDYTGVFDSSGTAVSDVTETIYYR